MNHDRDGEVSDTNKGIISTSTGTVVTRSIKRGDIGWCDLLPYIILSEKSKYQMDTKGENTKIFIRCLGFYTQALYIC